MVNPNFYRVISGVNEGGTDAKIKLCNGETIQHVPLLPILVKNRRRRRREEEVKW